MSPWFQELLKPVVRNGRIGGIAADHSDDVGVEALAACPQDGLAGIGLAPAGSENPDVMEKAAVGRTATKTQST
jgi:hypothetical protein